MSAEWSLRLAAALAASLPWLPAPALGESITISAPQPARYAEPSLLRRMVFGTFSGRGGDRLAAALAQRLTLPGPNGSPYFTLVAAAGRAPGVGIMSGNVRIDSSQVSFTQQQSRCVEGAGLLSCKRSIQVTVACARRTAMAVVDVQIVRALDRKVVYSTSKPYQDVSVWCEGSAPPADLDTLFLAASDQIANAVLQDISPYAITYKVRLLESTKGLGKPAAASFKALIKTSTRDLPGSCAGWKALGDAGETAPALVFDLGVCREQAGDLIGAGVAYARAAALLPGDKTVAEAVGRVRSMVAARAAAEAQQGQRAAAERSEQQAAAAARRAEQQAVASAERAARTADATARRQEQRRTAAAAAAKAGQRAAVAKTYGASAADAILAGTVTRGMTPDQVKAAVGVPCRREVLSPTEQQWYCGGKRIIFSGGRVTFVR